MDSFPNLLDTADDVIEATGWQMSIINEKRYIDEINNISHHCFEAASEYAQLRGAFKSLSDLKYKAEDKGRMKECTIVAINESNRLRVARLISVVWSLSDKYNNKSILTSLESSGKLALEDKVSLSGDLTLHRMTLLYRAAAHKFPSIIENNLRAKAKGLKSLDDNDAVRRRVEKTTYRLEHASKKIDAHLSDSLEWKIIDVIRNQGIAHSLNISRKSIQEGWNENRPSLSYDELFTFGNRAAQLALDFHSAWNFEDASKKVDDISSRSEAVFREHWSNIISSKALYT